MFNNESEQTNDMKPLSRKIITMINQLKKRYAFDFSFTFNVDFNCLMNKYSLIFYV